MSRGQAFRVYNLVSASIFFFSFYFQYSEKDMVSPLPAPAARPAASFCKFLWSWHKNNTQARPSEKEGMLL